MIGLIIRLVVNALAVFAVPYVVPGVHVAGFGSAVVAAIIFGIVNAVIRPIVFLITLPAVILTLGLFTIIINAIMFEIVAHVGIGVTVESFVAAILGALVLSIVSFILSTLVKAAEEPAK